MRTWPADWLESEDCWFNHYDTSLLYHRQPIRIMHKLITQFWFSPLLCLKKKKKGLLWNLLGNLDLLSPCDSFYGSLMNAACFVAQLVKNHLQCGRPRFNSWVAKMHRSRDRLPTPVFLGFPGGSSSKESVCNVGDLGSILGLGRSPGEVNSYPVRYSGLDNSMERIVHGYSLQRVR